MRDRIPTALILGAGASMPYGFPSGEDLVSRIVESMRYDVEINEVEPLFGERFPREVRHAFGDTLERSSRASIDSFLEGNRRFEAIGKRAIAYHLIRCEDRDRVLRFRQSQEGKIYGWYRYFFNNILFRGGPDEIVKRRPVLVLTFNYDRSFEFALSNALQAGWGLSDDATRELFFKCVKMVHLHGDLGVFFEGDGPPGDHREYSARLTPEALDIAERRLSVVHDDSEATLVSYRMANEELQHYRAAAFMGFAYSEVSLRRLRHGLVRDDLGLWGTCFGLRATESWRIEDGLGKTIPMLLDTDCLSFMQTQNIFGDTRPASRRVVDPSGGARL